MSAPVTRQETLDQVRAAHEYEERLALLGRRQDMPEWAALHEHRAKIWLAVERELWGPAAYDAAMADLDAAVAA